MIESIDTMTSSGKMMIQMVGILQNLKGKCLKNVLKKDLNMPEKKAGVGEESPN
ncbi:hypothetical protein [Chryseobacterium nematophagum]|uniref:hypothetical protein n=1 Tax=Chryseobacterium nematophagum TaxID=2305228 RepID=UPI001E604585|nr:hypothetical protein [Chryseobacterium nematophagum]